MAKKQATPTKAAKPAKQTKQAKQAKPAPPNPGARYPELQKPYCDWYKINDATPAMGLKHSQYVRQLVRKNRDKTILNPATNQQEPICNKVQMKSYEVWLINPVFVEGYQTRTTTRLGLRRYLVRFDSAVVDADALSVAIQAAVAGFYPDKAPTDLTENEFSFEPAYKKKKASTPAKAKDLTEVAEEDIDLDLDF